jgi:predicted adenylyl cyclase CyaB
MPRNIEIKARVQSLRSVAEIVAPLADQGPLEIHQDDTFFNCSNGRLKLRSFSDNTGELIFYNRVDESGPKLSSYQISHTSEPDQLRELLTAAYGQLGRVRKHRTLYIIERTRVHLDAVEEFGNFLELEVVLDDTEPLESGASVARELMRKLEIAQSDLIEGAYLDLVKSGSVSL